MPHPFGDDERVAAHVAWFSAGRRKSSWRVRPHHRATRPAATRILARARPCPLLCTGRRVAWRSALCQVVRRNFFFEDCRAGADTDGVVQTQPAQLQPEIAGGAEGGIRENDALRNTGLDRTANHVESKVGLRLENHVVRDARFEATRRVRRPAGRQDTARSREGRAPSASSRSKLTPSWRLVTSPAEPVDCRCTPTECFPCFRKPVSSRIQVSTFSRAVIASSACRVANRRTSRSLQLELPMKCNSR